MIIRRLVHITILIFLLTSCPLVVANQPPGPRAQKALELLATQLATEEFEEPYLQMHTVRRLEVGHLAAPMLIEMIDGTDSETFDWITRALIEIAPQIPDDQIQYLMSQLVENTEKFKVRPLMGKIGQPVVPYLVELMQSPKDSDRAWGLSRIRQLGAYSAQLRPALINLLNDPYVGVRYTSISLLRDWGIGDERFVETLVGLLHDENFQFRTAVMEVLGLHGEEGASAIPALAQIVANPEDSFRYMACSTLGWLGEGAVGVLVNQLTQDTDKSMPFSAALGLGRLGLSDERTLGALRQGLRDDNSIVRVGSAYALWKMGADANKALPILIDALGEERSGGQAYAIEPIGCMLEDGADGAEHLISLLKNSDNRRLPGDIYVAIRRVSPFAKHVLPDLIDLYDNGDPNVISAIQLTGRPSSEWIRKGLGSEDIYTIRKTLRLMADEIPSKDYGEFVDSIIGLLKHSDSSIRDYSQKILEGHLISQYVKHVKFHPAVLFAGMYDPPIQVIANQVQGGQRIAKAIRESRYLEYEYPFEVNKTPLESILECFGSEYGNARERGLKLCEQYSEEHSELIGHARALLDDEDVQVRLQAGLTVFRLTGESAKGVKIARSALDSKYVNVRSLACGLMGVFGELGENDVDLLRARLDDPYHNVRVFAALSLSMGGGDKRELLGPLLDIYLHSDDQNVGDLALKVLVSMNAFPLEIREAMRKRIVPGSYSGGGDEWFIYPHRTVALEVDAYLTLGERIKNN